MATLSARSASRSSVSTLSKAKKEAAPVASAHVFWPEGGAIPATEGHGRQALSVVWRQPTRVITFRAAGQSLPNDSLPRALLVASGQSFGIRRLQTAL